MRVAGRCDGEVDTRLFAALADAAEKDLEYCLH